jgi:hypothetical protein
MEYNGPDRRKNVRLSNEDFERIKAEVKQELRQELLAEIGSSALSQLRWILFLGFIASATWLAGKGFLKP